MCNKATLILLVSHCQATLILLILLCNCQTVFSYYHLHVTNIDANVTSRTFTVTSETYHQVFTWRDSARTLSSSSSSITIFTTEVPLLFSIISITVRTPRTEQQSYSYSIDILINSTCPSKRESNVTFIFYSSSIDETKRCSVLSKPHGSISCENFTYGILYNIDGYLLCNGRNITLSTQKELYEIAKPKYFNSTSSSESIDTRFFLPGFFHRLVIEITSINQTCSIAYSSLYSPFYRCLFENLQPAQWFVLTYYALNRDEQVPSGDATIVYTDLEDLYFSCQLNEQMQQIDFSWANLTAVNYNNLTMSVSTDENKGTWTISCNPYLSQDVCSTKSYRLQPGREYQIVAKLSKTLPNYNGEKTGTCVVKTDLSRIPVNSIEQQFLNETVVRLTWLEHPFHLQIQLRNLETNQLENSVENNRKSALFVNLTDGSVYQLIFNISKSNWSSILQITDYYIQTDLKKLMIENIDRLSDNSLMININRYDLSRVKLLFCAERLINQTSKICSTSNTFRTLVPGSIYNISASIERESFEKKFNWTKQTALQLVNTYSYPLQIRTWKTNENCAGEILNSFSIPYTIECRFNGRINDCNQLQCGCRYDLHLLFNQNLINSLCSITPCDIQFSHSNFTTVQFQTPLEVIRNLRIISLSAMLGEIVVDFDQPNGCFDRLDLICETIPLKQRRIFVNSTSCTDLIPDQLYRVYVETKRFGWDTVTSQGIETRLVFTSKIEKETVKKSLIIPFLIGVVSLLIIIVLIILLFVYRRRRKKSSLRDNQQTTINNNTHTTTKLNNIVNQVNIYSTSKQIHPTGSERSLVTSRSIRIKDLPFEYKQLIANNYFNLSDEFHKLQNSLEEIPQLTQSDQLFQNRYKDIIPYEHSRVKLIPIDECDLGYINANFISGLHNPREYIACQGPLKNTIDSHWQMIWEQNVMIIVMLTGLIERGISKCERYWPLDINHVEIFGSISVSVTTCVNVPAYDLRCIQIQKNEQVHLVKHYAFKMWDDHTVPTNSDALIDFIRLIRSEYHPEKQGPMLVHCSAGVGRSGTFIALDRLLQQFDKLSVHGYLDIYRTVLDMRRCRDKMVQNEHQYLFLYRCLKEQYEKMAGNANHVAIADDPV